MEELRKEELRKEERRVEELRKEERRVEELRKEEMRKEERRVEKLRKEERRVEKLRQKELREERQKELEEVQRRLEEKYGEEKKEEEKCSICCEDLKVNFIQTGCNHGFHLECMQRMMISSEEHGPPKCPNCRAVLKNLCYHCFGEIEGRKGSYGCIHKVHRKCKSGKECPICSSIKIKEREEIYQAECIICSLFISSGEEAKVSCSCALHPSCLNSNNQCPYCEGGDDSEEGLQEFISMVENIDSFIEHRVMFLRMFPDNHLVLNLLNQLCAEEEEEKSHQPHGLYEAVGNYGFRDLGGVVNAAALEAEMNERRRRNGEITYEDFLEVYAEYL